MAPEWIAKCVQVQKQRETLMCPFRHHSHALNITMS